MAKLNKFPKTVMHPLARFDRTAKRPGTLGEPGATPGPRSALDAEGTILLDCGFLFLDTAHVGEPRSLPQTLVHFRKFRRRTHRVHFHPSIVQIAGVAGELQLSRYALNEVAVTDSLDSPTNEIAPGGWY